MVFSSLPVNQFDSHNWQQQGSQHHQQDCVTADQNPNNYLPHLSSPPASQAGSSQARVNSMVERARMEKVPLPEAALKCPRCDSINTKFCYFNNYSLTQPRHFCKTCRRYWTRGGALRNVPVGGGFRRNKRSKSNGGGSGGAERSKSKVVDSADNNTTTSSLTSHPSYSNPSKFLSHGQILGFNSSIPILPPLQSLGDYNSSNIGLDFGGIQISNAISGMSGGILDPWRISSSQQAQQFPFLVNTTGLEQSSNVLYPLLEGSEGANQGNHQQESSDFSNQLRSKPLMDMASGGDSAAQPRNVKAEENDRDQNREGDGVNNLSRNFLGNINIHSAGNDGYTSWGGNRSLNSSWTGFTSNNSTGHISF